VSSNLGNLGEEQAVAYLQSQGLRLLERQFKTRYGEIDCIFKDKDSYVFVEVKTRSEVSESFPAVTAVTAAKQRRLTNAAYFYVKKNRLENENFRFDLVMIEGSKIEWIPNAFEVSSRYSL
jgi:putative endonuclease